MKVSKWLIMACCFAMLAYMSFAVTGCDDSTNGEDGDLDGDTDAVSDGDTDATDGDTTEAVDGDIDAATDGDTDSDAEGNTDGDVDVEEELEDPNPLAFLPAGPDAAPDPMQMGPFPVGVKTFTFTYTTDSARPEERTITVEVWYPATQAFKDGPFEKIDMKEEAKTAPLDEAKREVIVNSTIQAFETKSVRDADIDKGHGPYPLVVFSHGCNGIRWQSIFYTIHLASHGYVVVSPDHYGNTLWDLVNDGYEGNMLDYISDRTYDIPKLLDTVVEKNQNPEDFFYGSVNEDQIAISGHSLGGITASFSICQDERYKAVVYHSPVISVGQMVGGCLAEDCRVPSLTMGGTEDNTLPYCGQYCDYKNSITGDQPKYLYQLERGGHFTFSDICRLDLIYLSEELEMGSNAEDALTDGCHETDNAPWAAAHQSINYYATAFLNLYLRGSTGSAAYLVNKTEAPFDNVEFYEGDVPDWREEGGCEECEAF